MKSRVRKLLGGVVVVLLFVVFISGCLTSEGQKSNNSRTTVKVVGNYSNGQVLLEVKFAATSQDKALEYAMNWSAAHGCKVLGVTGATYNDQYNYWLILDCTPLEEQKRGAEK